MTDTTRKTGFFQFDPKAGIYRVGRVILITGKGYAMGAIAGIGHINLSRVTGVSVTIRVPGGTDKTSKWLKIGQSDAGGKIGTTVTDLPIYK